MDVKMINRGSTPVEKKEDNLPKVHELTPSEATAVAEAEAGSSRVEPVQQKPLIKVFVDEDTGRPSFLVIDEGAEEPIREATPEEILEMAAEVDRMEGFLIDELV